VSAWKELYEIPDQAKVIVPACTWVTNVAPIIQCGLTPVFCDINLEDYSFDTHSLQGVRDEYGDDIHGIFVTHLLGFPAKVKLFHEMFPKAHILEDVCESHGAVLEDGTKAGTFDVGGTFSFYFGHHMTTIEGGMVSTNDPELYDLMRIKRSHGMARESLYFETYKEKYPDINPQFLFVTDGYNFRNTDLAAVLGQSQLKRLDNMIEIRNRNYELYLQVIKKYDNLFYIPDTQGTVSSFCFPFVSQFRDNHDNTKQYMEDYHIECRPIVGGNLLRQPFLREYSGECPKADIVNQMGLYIGNNHFVGESDFHMLDEILREL
jgi:CDP-6-deoxy-D-xylo-4-hexulose-3-dehydrase